MRATSELGAMGAGGLCCIAAIWVNQPPTASFMSWPRQFSASPACRPKERRLLPQAHHVVALARVFAFAGIEARHRLVGHHRDFGDAETVEAGLHRGAVGA